MAAPEASDWRPCRHHSLDRYLLDFSLSFFEYERLLAGISGPLVVALFAPAERRDKKKEISACLQNPHANLRTPKAACSM